VSAKISNLGVARWLLALIYLCVARGGSSQEQKNRTAPQQKSLRAEREAREAVGGWDVSYQAVQEKLQVQCSKTISSTKAQLDESAVGTVLNNADN